MKSYLQRLENNEAILLMYLADELPAQDRAEFEQMLAADAGLRGELEILRQTQQLAFDALESLDAVTRPAIGPAVAHRQVGQLVHEWANRRRRAMTMPSGARPQWAWRQIGFAAAAVLLVGFYIWAVYHPLPGPSTPQQRGVTHNDPIPHRDLSSEEKVALLSIPLEDSTSEESNLHVAEVAAVIPSDAENSGDANHGADLNPSNTPSEP